jgi:hypothetical protein
MYCTSSDDCTYREALHIFYVSRLQLTLSTDNLEQSPPITQHHLPLVILRHEANLLKPILQFTGPPGLRRESVAGEDGRGKPGLEFPQVFWVAATKRLQDTVGGGVPTVQAVDDGPSETHLLTGFRGGVQRVVVTIQTAMTNSISLQVLVWTFLWKKR